MNKKVSTTVIATTLALSGAVVSLMQTLLVPLLPDLPGLIHVSSEDASWLITATLLASAVATPSLTKLADMFGKRRMMFISLGAMVLGSAVGALGKSLIILILARALQGFAMALIPIGISIMRDELPKEKLGSAVAMMSATLGIGAAIGLPLSGVVYSTLGWHAVFWFSAGLGLTSFIAVSFIVPESKVRTGGHFDFLGALLLSIALIGLLLGITKGGAWGWSSQSTLFSLAVFAIALALWIPFELRAMDPLVDLRTFSRKAVMYTNISSLLVGFAMYANMLTTTQLLQIPKASGYGLGISVIAAGVALLPSGLTMVAFAPASARITKLFGAERTLFVGAGILSIGYVIRIFLLHSEFQIITGAIILSAGTAVAYAAMPTLIMQAVPITETSSANGVNTVVRTIGTATSSAAMATLLSTNVIHIGGHEYPKLSSFQHVYVLAALAAAMAGVITLWIPRQKNNSQKYLSEKQTEDHLIRGKVQDLQGRGIPSAIINISTLTGEKVDWARSSSGGEFSVVIPELTKYLVIATAPGWAPKSAVLSIHGDIISVHLSEALLIKGVVLLHGLPVSGGVVVLNNLIGDSHFSATTDREGHFSLPLPHAGNYLLTCLTGDEENIRTWPLRVGQRPLEMTLELAYHD